MDEAEGNLLDVTPTTIAGVTALLSYAAEHVRRGEDWLDGYEDSNATCGLRRKIGIPFETALNLHVVSALEQISAHRAESAKLRA
jgi:hypothetical protein